MNVWDIRPSDEPAAAAAQPATPARRKPPSLRAVRRGVVVLRFLGVAIIAIGLVGQLRYFTSSDTFGTDVSLADRLYESMQGLVFPLGFGGMVIAASVLTQVFILRLEHDLEIETPEPARRPNARGDLVVKAPPRRSSSVPAASDDSIWQPAETPTDARL